LLLRAGSPLLCADAPHCLRERRLRRPSPFAESAKRLEHQILKLNGFSNPYCQIKWIFPSIMTPIKSLISLESNSHAKMAPDNHNPTRRLYAAGAAAFQPSPVDTTWVCGGKGWFR
jgi:hypothetical protein